MNRAGNMESELEVSLKKNLPAILQNFEDVVSESVPIFLQKSISVVEDLTRVVPDAKLGIVYFRFHVVRIVLERDRRPRKDYKMLQTYINVYVTQCVLYMTGEVYKLCFCTGNCMFRYSTVPLPL